MKPVLITATLALLSICGPAVAQSGMMEAVAAACKPDVARLCSGVAPGEGRIKECLKANRREVSFGCKKALYEAKKAKDAQSAAPAH